MADESQTEEASVSTKRAGSSEKRSSGKQVKADLLKALRQSIEEGGIRKYIEYIAKKSAGGKRQDVRKGDAKRVQKEVKKEVGKALKKEEFRRDINRKLKEVVRERLAGSQKARADRKRSGDGTVR